MDQEVAAGRVDGQVDEPAQGRNKEVIRVLVVDDSPVDRKVVENLLTRNCSTERSFNVVAVESGKKAIELLGMIGGEDKPGSNIEGNIDIVLTDYCMPEMTGLELLKIIKEQHLGKPLPVIVMSSENDTQRINRCLMAGAEDFLLKPLQTKDVQRLQICPGVVAAGSVCSPGNKRKAPSDCKAEEKSSERRARIAEVAIA